MLKRKAWSHVAESARPFRRPLPMPPRARPAGPTPKPAAPPKPRTVADEDVLAWMIASGRLGGFATQSPDSPLLDRLPGHLRFVVARLAAEGGGRPAPDALDSIPFRSLCLGALQPMSDLKPERAARLFGVRLPPPDALHRRRVLDALLAKPVGLTLPEKIACVTGDPFGGRASTFRQDRLLQLLASVWFRGRRRLLDRLAAVGDLAALFAESRPTVPATPPLTAAEVLRTLRFLPDAGLNEKMAAARSLLVRCGRVEAYFLARLLTSRTGLGADDREEMIAEALAARFGVPAAKVERAVALTDVHHVAAVLERDGPAGLERLRLQPLVPVRPALASGTTDELREFPVWVERKYDGVRFLLHKAVGPGGVVGCAAFTRNRNDWLALVPGLEQVIRALPARGVILDGELCGETRDADGRRPAAVDDVMRALSGEPVPVRLRYVAFDLLHLDGRDLTGLPLTERRRLLTALLLPLRMMRLPLPVSLSEGQLAHGKADVNRLYHHFLAQGHEGVITKRPDAPYAVARRDPNWLKRKEEATLDLVLLGATFSADPARAGAFGSYVLGARTPEGGFADVGDVDGVGWELDLAIREAILREGLLTGRRIERQLTHGWRAGVELHPGLVVTAKFQKVSRESDGTLSLRHPVLKLLRPDKPACEADTTADIAALAGGVGASVA